MANNVEGLQNNHEGSLELNKDSSFDRLEKLNGELEGKSELSPRDIESKSEKAKIEALEIAISVEAGGKEKDAKPKHRTDNRRGPISKKQQNESYKKTMDQIQGDLSAGGKVFSKFIHNKYVENTSEAIGSTIARPNALLAGSIFAFLLTLIAYTVAKTIGYELSGFESIAAFVIGWSLGLIFDYIKLLFTGKK